MVCLWNNDWDDYYKVCELSLGHKYHASFLDSKNMASISNSSSRWLLQLFLIQWFSPRLSKHNRSLVIVFATLTFSLSDNSRCFFLYFNGKKSCWTQGQNFQSSYRQSAIFSFFFEALWHHYIFFVPKYVAKNKMGEILYRSFEHFQRLSCTNNSGINVKRPTLPCV